MSRRLLGYVVKLPDGTRHIEGLFSLLDAVSISHGSVPPTHVTPVFAVRKPKFGPRVRLGEWAGSPEAAASVTGPAPWEESAQVCWGCGVAKGRVADAIAAAVRAERERVCALAATLFDSKVTPEELAKLADAAKGQAK